MFDISSTIKFDQEEFNQRVIDLGVISIAEEETELNSGRWSNWYVNWRVPTSDVYTSLTLAGNVIGFVKGLGLTPKTFYGVPEGATKLGLQCQTSWALQDPELKQNKYTLAMGRGKPKEHGKPEDRHYLGVPNGDVVVLEDVTTTGGSLMKSIEALLDTDGIDSLTAVGLTNRQELRDDGRSVKQAIKEEYDVDYHEMGKATDLLPLFIKQNPQEDSIIKKIERYFERYGAEDIKLRP